MRPLYGRLEVRGFIGIDFLGCVDAVRGASVATWRWSSGGATQGGDVA